MSKNNKVKNKTIGKQVKRPSNKKVRAKKEVEPNLPKIKSIELLNANTNNDEQIVPQHILLEVNKSAVKAFSAKSADSQSANFNEDSYYNEYASQGFKKEWIEAIKHNPDADLIEIQSIFQSAGEDKVDGKNIVYMTYDDAKKAVDGIKFAKEVSSILGEDYKEYQTLTYQERKDAFKQLRQAAKLATANVNIPAPVKPVPQTPGWFRRVINFIFNG